MSIHWRFNLLSIVRRYYRLCWSSRLWLYLWLHRSIKLNRLLTQDFVSTNRSLSNNIHICQIACIFRQTNHMGKSWIANSNLIWNKQFHIYTKDFLSQFFNTRKDCASTDNHNTTRKIQQMSSLKVLLNLLKDVFDTCRNDFSQILLSHFNWLNFTNNFYMEYFVSSRWHIGFTVVELQTFCQFLRSLQNFRNIFGHVIATFLVDICKLKFLATNRCHCGLATTHINHCCSEFTFAFVQDCFDHRKWGNDDVFYL